MYLKFYLILIVLLNVKHFACSLSNNNNNNFGHDFNKVISNRFSPDYKISGGSIYNLEVVLEKAKSPYLIENDLIIEQNASLKIQPGVIVTFEATYGLIIRGQIEAIGTENEKIIFTNINDESIHNNVNISRKVRLVDGPNSYTGRLQIFHLNNWRSVCTNSKNWTQSDFDTVCRQLGFQKGFFYKWYDRQHPLKSRLLYQAPNCTDISKTVFDCNWNNRKLGSGICDYHPDLGIKCESILSIPSSNWKGIRFENALDEKNLMNSLYLPISKSKLQFVEIKNAGNGRYQKISSALHITGTAPFLSNVYITQSLSNGISINDCESYINIHKCRISENNGYGIYIRSNFGYATIDQSTISDNKAGGVKYVRNSYKQSNKINLHNICVSSVIDGQKYPIKASFEQNSLHQRKKCSQLFSTEPNEVFTVFFKKFETNSNDSVLIKIHDGPDSSHRLLTSFRIRNETQASTVTTTRNRIFFEFDAESHVQSYVEFHLFSFVHKIYDLKISNSDITNNNGQGVWIQMLQSQLLIINSLISNNSHIAGVHVESGVGDVNITHTRITYNQCDGLNITYSGGNRNISRSTINSNIGHGVAIWLNKTFDDYVFNDQLTVIEYSEIFRNLDVGIYHGNFCSHSIPLMINITGNIFQNNMDYSIDIKSCWKSIAKIMQLYIGHNIFKNLERTAMHLSPLLNALTIIEYNHFEENKFGSIYIKNAMSNHSYFKMIQSTVSIESNKFFYNKGSFVVNLGLVPFSTKQHILFKYNHLRNNEIFEYFPKLTPRSRVAAVIALSSNNVIVFRNLIDNPKSNYEIGSHFEDQSATLNCTFNWLGSVSYSEVNQRIFHWNDRFNLAKIAFLPFLLHNNSYYTDNVFKHESQPSPLFIDTLTNSIGGEIQGQEILYSGEYIVKKDINIRHSGELVIKSGVVLKFLSSVGMLINGKLDLPVTSNQSNSNSKVLFTLYDKDKEIDEIQKNYKINEPIEHVLIDDIVEIEDNSNIRLVDGNSTNEGRLEILRNGTWGTVCNYGWDILDASLVCFQLGLILNPNDWFLNYQDIPQNTKRVPKVLLTNVQCTELDSNFLNCKAENELDFENTCHELSSIVHMKCYERSWAGLRYGILLKRADFRNVRVEHAGLFDYATYALKPAVQIDLMRHRIENVEISSNYFDALGITYTDLYSSDATNVLKESKIESNKGNGIILRQLGLKITDCKIESNYLSGIKHDQEIEKKLQLSFLTNWLNFDKYYDQYNKQIIFLPFSDSKTIFIDHNTKYLITSELKSVKNIHEMYEIQSKSIEYILGIQILNPIIESSSEKISIYDSLKINNNKSEKWSIKNDLVKFPKSSTSYGIILEYKSGDNAIGNVIIAITAIYANVKNKITKLTVTKSKIRRNRWGLNAVYYNTEFNTESGSLYLRKANETIEIARSEITENQYSGINLQSINFSSDIGNLSEIEWVINQTLIAKNGNGLLHDSRDLRNSSNLFHFRLFKNMIRNNEFGAFQFSLPYVWQYNENYTHSIVMINNTWSMNKNFRIKIDGHFAKINISENIFNQNECSSEVGLIYVLGMEKQLKIDRNRFENNDCDFVIYQLIDSQSEILGKVPANIFYNIFRNNSANKSNFISSTISIKGIQRIEINYNIIENNRMDYQLIAGLKTSKIPNSLNVKQNWWNTLNENIIENYIFDFNNWNSFALADYKPFLLTNKFQAQESSVYNTVKKTIDFDSLGGQLIEYLILRKRSKPYFVKNDLTIMPNSTLIIEPGVIIEFKKSIGILVLGTIIAKGTEKEPIIMRPRILNEKQLTSNYLKEKKNIRLCKNILNGCHDENYEGFLEYFNSTTFQWVPICDDRFNEKNSEVVCEELGYDRFKTFYSFGKRYDLHENDLKRIGSWMQYLQCTGNEKHFVDCPIRISGRHFGKKPECHKNSDFVFINCRQSDKKIYWGGIRITNSEFETESIWNRNHDIYTHKPHTNVESHLEFIQVVQAGMLHDEKSPAILAVFKSPIIHSVQILESASDGIIVLNPMKSLNFNSNQILNNFGIGMHILSLTGEGSNGKISTFDPFRKILLPNGIFGTVDMCDSFKEVFVEEKVLVYYKYENHPVHCIKFFRNRDTMRTFSFRLLNVNFFNWTNEIGEPDSITLYDGNIYDTTESKFITKISIDSIKNIKYVYETTNPSLSIKLFTNGASSKYGFVAEIVSVPITTITFNRDIQHNVSYSSLIGNFQEAFMYSSIGEINPIITLSHNQFIENCQQFYGNFSSCNSAIKMDLQNTPRLDFQFNLVEKNQGGLRIEADSYGLASSLKANIKKNLFHKNKNYPIFYIESKRLSPYQEVLFYKNYVTQNTAQYENIIELVRVVSNFTYNFIKRNVGSHLLTIYGLSVFQSISHNGFYENYATDYILRSTIVAGSIGQQYIDNILYNPNNDYEIATTNISMMKSNRFPMNEISKIKINASFNYWGYNHTLTIASRIHDNYDDPYLLKVIFEPFYMNNKTVLINKCPPAWNLVGTSCFMYIRAPMSYKKARDFCKLDNASMPYFNGNDRELYQFLIEQSDEYITSDRVWIQHIDLMNKCTAFSYYKIQEDNCNNKNGFICEIDPEIKLDVLSLKDDMITLSIVGLLLLSLLLIVLTIMLWQTKNKQRNVERFQRRNSIRQSVNSLRSLGTSTIGSMSDFSSRKKINPMNSKSNEILSRNSIYKKMPSNDGSLESMEKRIFDENHSFDIYEAHNPTLINDYLTNTAQNKQFFTNNSMCSFQSYENIPSSNIDGSMTMTFNSEAFPLNTFTPMHSNSANEIQLNENNPHNEIKIELPLKKRSKLTNVPYLPTPPTPPQIKYSSAFYDRPKSANLLNDCNLEERLRLSPKAKSEMLLETNFDYNPEMSLLHSQSQPLETAM